MIANFFKKSAGKLFAIGAAAVTLTAANPAMANASNSAEVTAPIKQSGAVAATPLGQSDEEFRRIFSSWEQIERKRGGIAAVPTTSISIPSGNPLENARMSSSYGSRTHPVLGGRRDHKGVDLAAPTGTPIYATADGMVSRANWFSSYGQFVSIEHGADIQTRFAHLSRIIVSEGEQVRKGDIIGYVGSTGRSTGPHLHYEVRVDGRAMNPADYINDASPVGRMAVAIGHDGLGG
ncbi:M23 family metallopeptidase [Altererythrobacter sp. CAU 1778]